VLQRLGNNLPKLLRHGAKLSPRPLFERLPRSGLIRTQICSSAIMQTGLSCWRERALAGAATALKERERDDRDDEIARLKSKVGEITVDNELLYAKIAAIEGKRPLAPRRSRR
jgi:hypothetical protein